MLLLPRPFLLHLSGEDYAGDMATKIPALSEPWVPGCRHNLRNLLIEEKCITNSAQVWRPERKPDTTPGVLLCGQALYSQRSLHPGPRRPGPGSLIGQSWPKATFLLSPGVTLATTSCKSEFQGVHPLFGGQSRRSSPTWCERREEPEPPGTVGHTKGQG